MTRRPRRFLAIFSRCTLLRAGRRCLRKGSPLLERLGQTWHGDLGPRSVSLSSRLRAVTELNDGAPVGEVAERCGVMSQTATAWLKRYDTGRWWDDGGGFQASVR